MEILILIKKQLKLLFKNRLVIFATICVPIALTYLFSYSINNAEKPQLYIADLDKSAYSAKLLSMLSNHKDITIVNSTEEEILKKVDDQNIAMGFVIDKDFEKGLLSGKTLPVKIIKNFDSNDSAVLGQILNNELSTLQKVVSDSVYISNIMNTKADDLSTQLLDSIASTSTIKIADKPLNNGANEQNDMTLRLLGFLVMFIWFVIIQGFRTLIDEKENYTFNRILSTPVNYNKYLFTKVIAAYLFGIFHVLAVLLAGKYFLNISIFNHILPIILVFAVYLFLLTGISLLFALFMKKHENYTITFAILIIVTGMLGGSFFSLEIAPSYMRTLSKFTPEAWALQILKSVIFNNQSVSSQWMPLLVLCCIAILCLLAASFLINKSIYKKRKVCRVG